MTKYGNPERLIGFKSVAFVFVFANIGTEWNSLRWSSFFSWSSRFNFLELSYSFAVKIFAYYTHQFCETLKCRLGSEFIVGFEVKEGPKGGREFVRGDNVYRGDIKMGIKGEG